MDNSKRNFEQLSSQAFGFVVERVDRERGHVIIVHGGREYKWHLMQDSERVVLVNGDERELTDAVRNAMRRQVRAILAPELRK